MLDMFQEQINDLHPEQTDIEKLLENSDQNSNQLATAEDVARNWRRQLDEVLGN
jgi:hypothetical protein